jgi:hypothetical protein
LGKDAKIGFDSGPQEAEQEAKPAAKGQSHAATGVPHKTHGQTSTAQREGMQLAAATAKPNPDQLQPPHRPGLALLDMPTATDPSRRTAESRTTGLDRGPVSAARAASPALVAPAPDQHPAWAEKELPVKPAARNEGPDGTIWLAEAIRTLRQKHAAGAALEILDRHAQELDKGGMSHEATLVRVEALLALHRSAEVLHLLDSSPLADATAARGLLLTRAELRAAAGRCSDGLGDFELVLARTHQEDERALYGRAVCRQRTGDSAGARQDFERYQRQFPFGSHIRDVERQLAGPAGL